MITRRTLFHSAAAAGLYSMLPNLTLAATNTDKRLIVIVQRGGMDSLDAIQPVGDADFAKLRPASGQGGPSESFAVDSFYAFNNALSPIHPLFTANELSVIHSVSTPYRDHSHFEAQDFLERGADARSVSESGWVNRLITLLGGRKIDFAVDIGSGPSLLLRGPAEILNLSPGVDLGFWADSPQFLEMLYKDVPSFKPALDGIRATIADGMAMENTDPGVSVRETCALAAKLMKEECRIAAFSIYGWDTHAGQQGRLAKCLSALSTAITTLKRELGPAWSNTLVIAASEFGRTARFNGTSGTDHGTGGAAFLAGGLLANGAGGKVLATRWPGLGDGKLHEDRDLMPTDDIRRYIAWALADIYGLSPGKIASDIFPGVDYGSKVKLI
jgi:uncharacterized protein (DUF1501 family)